MKWISFSLLVLPWDPKGRFKQLLIREGRKHRSKGGAAKKQQCRVLVPSQRTHAWVLSHFSRAWLFATPWTAAGQAPLSLGFSRQEHWSGFSCSPPADLPDPGIEPTLPSLTSPALAVGFFTTSATWEALKEQTEQALSQASLQAPSQMEDGDFRPSSRQRQTEREGGRKGNGRGRREGERVRGREQTQLLQPVLKIRRGGESGFLRLLNRKWNCGLMMSKNKS